MTHPLQPSVGSAVESKQHVVRRDIPVLQTYGPQQVHDLDGGQFGFAETVADYVEKLKDEPNTLDEGVQAIWHIFQQSTVKARDLRLLLNRIVVEIMGTMDEEDPAEAPLMHYLDNLLDAVAAVGSGSLDIFTGLSKRRRLGEVHWTRPKKRLRIWNSYQHFRIDFPGR